MPAAMLAYRDLEHGFHLALSAEWRPALVGFVVTLAAALGGRLLRIDLLALAACGLGVAAGWAVPTHPLAAAPSLPDRLPEMALLALLFACVDEARSHLRGRYAMLLGLALVGGWWLGGAAHSQAGLLHAWVSIAILAGWIAAAALLFAEADAWCVAAAALALWAALQAVGAPAIWPLLALVPAAAALGTFAGRAQERALLPASVGIGAVAGGAVALAGVLRHGRIGPIELAALAPFIVAWWSARLLPRLRRLGSAAPPAASVLALVGVVLIAYSAAALSGLR